MSEGIQDEIDAWNLDFVVSGCSMTTLRGPIYAGCRRLTVEAVEAIEMVRPIGLWNVDFRHRETPEYLKSGSVNNPIRLDTGCLPSSMKRFSRCEPISDGTLRMPASGAIHGMRIEDKKIGSLKRNILSKVSVPYLIQRGRRLRKSTSDYKSLSNM
jgi:hypothetical protein